MTDGQKQWLEIAGVVIGAVALIYELVHTTPTPANSVGATMPILLGSGGGGGVGLNAAAPVSTGTSDPTANLPPAIQYNLPPSTVGNTAPAIVNATANPNGSGCCGQTGSPQWISAPQSLPVPVGVTPSTKQVASAYTDGNVALSNANIAGAAQAQQAAASIARIGFVSSQLQNASEAINQAALNTNRWATQNAFTF